jgi:predicted transcriptional regulator
VPSNRARKNGRRPAGSLEAEVLASLWVAGRPLTPAEVRDDLGEELAYTTVMTTLSRLHAKGAVQRQRSGRAYAYTPVLDEAGLAASRMREMLDSRDDRAAVLAQFAGSLSAEEAGLLTQLLARAKADGNA